MKHLTCLLMLFALTLPGLAQSFDDEEPEGPRVLGGFLYQTAITQESYLITKDEELKSFVMMIPAVTPYKTLPAPPNPDPLLKDFTIDFEENVLAVAVGRNRIERPPVFQMVDESDDGGRLVQFALSKPTAEAYPFGWAVYTAVVIPRIELHTRVVVRTLP
jgi:hypothetical protein